MKLLFSLFALCLLAPVPQASAEEGAAAYTVMVVDWDARGTNMRDAPAGKVIKVIPFESRDRVRMVTIQDHSKGWFRVEFDGKTGWMHGSVLGTCADPTEDGDPALCGEPDNSGRVSEKIPSGAPVTLLDMHGSWLKVRYTDPKGKRHDGWLPQQSLMLSENSRQECAGTWAKK